MPHRVLRELPSLPRPEALRRAPAEAVTIAKVPVQNRAHAGTSGPVVRVLPRLPLSGMRVVDPTSLLKGVLVMAACLVGIPAVCRWIEDSVAQAHGAYEYPAIGISLLILMAATRLTASPPSLPPEREGARRNPPDSGPNRLRF